MQAPVPPRYRHPLRIEPISDEEAEALIERATRVDPVHGRVVRLRLTGHSYRAIAEALGTLSTAGAQHICDRWFKYDGRPKGERHQRNPGP